jgi:hypothetical protein
MEFNILLKRDSSLEEAMRMHFKNFAKTIVEKQERLIN